MEPRPRLLAILSTAFRGSLGVCFTSFGFVPRHSQRTISLTATSDHHQRGLLKRTKAALPFHGHAAQTHVHPLGFVKDEPQHSTLSYSCKSHTPADHKSLSTVD
jgi:hypothetical protein